MSKGLKELKELIIKLKSLGYTRCDEWLGFIIIERELKALEIIRKYHFLKSLFLHSPTYKVYEMNMSFFEDEDTMSEEEYKLLKEILNYDD